MRGNRPTHPSPITSVYSTAEYSMCVTVYYVTVQSNSFTMDALTIDIDTRENLICSNTLSYVRILYTITPLAGPIIVLQCTFVVLEFIPLSLNIYVSLMPDLHRFGYAPYHYFTSQGIPGPKPKPFIGSLDLIRKFQVCSHLHFICKYMYMCALWYILVGILSKTAIIECLHVFSLNYLERQL